MKDKKVVDGYFPNAKLRKLYDRFIDVLEDDDFDSLSCAEVIGAIEMIKMDYIIQSMENE